MLAAATLSLATSACGGGDPGGGGPDNTGGSGAEGGAAGEGGTAGTGGTAGNGGSGGSGGEESGPFVLLKDMKTGYPANQAHGAPSLFTESGGKVFYSANSDSGDNELWVTDGTKAGTQRLLPGIYVNHFGAGEHFEAGFQDVNGKLFFPGNGALWVSDGTESGTVLVKDVTPGAARPVGNQLLFMADDGTHGWEMWASNGTGAGTRLVKDMVPGGQGWSNYARRITWEGKLYFHWAHEDENGIDYEHFTVTDGTEEGTVTLRQGTDPGSGVFLDYDIIAFKDRVFFTYYTASEGVELWVTDGTKAGTKLFKDLNTKPNGSGWAQDFHVLDDKLLFFAYDDSYKFALWASDGTPEGTEVISYVEHGPVERAMPAVGGKLVFNGRPSGTFETFTLWVTDGTSQGTHSISDIAAYSDHHFTPVGDKLLFFGGTYLSSDIEPWVTDGTPEGTHLVKDIAPGDDGSAPADYSNPSYMVTLGGKAYFRASVGYNDVHLFESDGTEAGTKVLAPADATNTTNPVGNIVLYKDMLLLAAKFHDVGTELYRYKP